MLEILDHDSLVNILEFLSLSDIIESFSMINSDIYHLFNNDHQGFLIRLITDKILFSEEQFIVLYNYMDQHCVVESLLDQEENHVINCKYLSKICEEEKHDEKKVIERIMFGDEKCLFIDDYSKMKTCWECCRRLSFMKLWSTRKEFKNRNVELRYCVDHQNKNDCSVVYMDFLKLAESHEFSKDRVYKFSFDYSDKLNLRKIHSKTKEICQKEKEIFLRDNELYSSLIYPQLYHHGISLLLHQETIENNITISTTNVQDTNSYKNSCYMVRGYLFPRPLYDINSFFHDMSAPDRCGDLRASRKGDLALYTISRKDIKQLVSRSMITNAIVLPISLCAVFYFTNPNLDWESDGYIHPFLCLLDAVTFMAPSFLISDHGTNRYRRVSTQDIHLLIKVGVGSLLLKIALALVLPFGFLRVMFHTYSFTLPYVPSLVSIMISGCYLAKTSFWYARSCGWFYKLTRSQSLTGRIFNKVVSWITRLSLLTSVDHDTEERCVVN